MAHYWAKHSFAHASRSYYGDPTFYSAPFFHNAVQTQSRLQLSLSLIWILFRAPYASTASSQSRVSMLGLPWPVNHWKRGHSVATLSIVGLRGEEIKCELMNECLAVHLRLPSTQLKLEHAPDTSQASNLKEKRVYFVCWSGVIE